MRPCVAVVLWVVGCGLWVVGCGLWVVCIVKMEIRKKVGFLPMVGFDPTTSPL